MRFKLVARDEETLYDRQLYRVLLLLSEMTIKGRFLDDMEKRIGEKECKEKKCILGEEKIDKKPRSLKNAYYRYEKKVQPKAVVPGSYKSDILSAERVTGRLNALHVAFPEIATEKGPFVFDGSKGSIDEAVKLLDKCFEFGLKLNTTVGFKWLKALEELNLFCLSRSRNILVDLGIKSAKPWPKKLVESVLGPLPHGVKPGLYEPFLVTLIKGFNPDFKLIYKIFWDTLKNLEYEHLDEGFYPPENNEFKKLAKEALATPKTLEYSPDLLRICLKTAESKIAVFSKGKADRASMVAAIQNSINSVPNIPSAIRVQRQINDLQLILSGNMKRTIANQFLPRLIFCQKKPTIDSKALSIIEFDGSSKAIEAAHDLIRVVHRAFSPNVGSAVWHCYVKLVEELNLYCLSTGTGVKWGPEWERPQLSRKLLDDVVGSKFSKEIEGKDFQEFLMNPNAKPSSEPFLLTANAKPYSNGFLIKRALKKAKFGGDTKPNDQSISATNSSQEHTDIGSLSNIELLSNLTDNNNPPNSTVTIEGAPLLSKGSGELINSNSHSTNNKPPVSPKPTNLVKRRPFLPKSSGKLTIHPQWEGKI